MLRARFTESIDWERIDSPWHEVPALRGTGRIDTSEESLYRAIDGATSSLDAAALVGIPYFAWANREAGAMRVLIPLSGQ